MKNLLLVAILMCAQSAFAQEKPAKIESQTRATGKEVAIYLSVSSCSTPSIPTNSFTREIQSNFEYKVCRELKTVQYTVTGSNWNQDRQEIPGTATFSYQIETVKKGSSFWLAVDAEGNIDPLSYAMNVSNVIVQCRSMQQLVAQQSRQLQDTPCSR